MKAIKQPPRRGHVVTFTDPNITRSHASSILGVSDMHDGIKIMATNSDLSKVKSCHFEGLGSAYFTSLDEDKVSRYREDTSNIVSVEEDIDVTVFYDMGTPNGNGGQRANDVSQDFDRGYDQGIAYISNKIIEALRNVNDTGNPKGGTELIIPKSNAWNIDLVKAPQAWARGFNGKGVKVAVLDTGIANHAALTISGGACFVPGIADYHDDHGHGTHCAGIIGAKNHNQVGVIGVAPNASLYAVKVLNSAGEGQMSWILAGMAWALNQGMNVVSMSLGSQSEPMVAYQTAIAQLIAGGVSVVCASGNSFDKDRQLVGAPANSHTSAIAVGAVDRTKAITPFSCRGIKDQSWNSITVVAPGSWVNSTWPTPANNYKQDQGTSMAAPHVAGAIALLLQRFPYMTPLQIKEKIIKSASDLGDADIDPIFGAGLLDCDALTI